MKRTVTLLATVALLAAVTGTAGATTKNYNDYTHSPGSDNTHFGVPDTEYWDLTQCDLTLTYRIDMSAVTQSQAGETPYVEVGVREVGASDFNPGTFGTHPGGKGGWMNSLVTDLGTDPNNLDVDDKHNLSSSGGRGEQDYDATAPNTVVSPFGTFSHKGIYGDRDGVDPYQDDKLANTGGIYDLVITYHAIDAGQGTMFSTLAKADGTPVTTGFDTTTGDGFNVDTDPAGLSFTGDMTKMQVFTGAWYTSGAGGDVVVSDITADGCFVPEPATMGLLALGGLALLRRRSV
jgi:hypothetical protein